MYIYLVELGLDVGRRSGLLAAELVARKDHDLQASTLLVKRSIQLVHLRVVRPGLASRAGRYVGFGEFRRLEVTRNVDDKTHHATLVIRTGLLASVEKSRVVAPSRSSVRSAWNVAAEADAIVVAAENDRVEQRKLVAFLGPRSYWQGRQFRVLFDWCPLRGGRAARRSTSP